MQEEGAEHKHDERVTSVAFEVSAGFISWMAERDSVRTRPIAACLMNCLIRQLASVCKVPGECDGRRLNAWLSQLLSEKGNDLYRSKGVLAIHRSPEKCVFTCAVIACVPYNLQTTLAAVMVCLWCSFMPLLQTCIALSLDFLLGHLWETCPANVP